MQFLFDLITQGRAVSQTRLNIQKKNQLQYLFTVLGLFYLSKEPFFTKHTRSYYKALTVCLVLL